MRIALTGVSGQVGGALRSVLHHHDVVSLDRTALDLTQVQQIRDVLDRILPDIIINPAAYTAVDKAEDDRDTAYAVNAEAPAAMAKWAAARGVPLIHFSTDYVFDGSGTRPWREDDPTGPLCVYGASKLASEHAIRSAQGCFLIVRTSWVYAATGSNFLRAIMRRASDQKELRVVADQIGAPTSAGLIADAVGAMLGDDLRSFRDRCAGADGVVHVAAGGETSWHGFATAIVSDLKSRGSQLAVQEIIPIRTDEYPTRARRPHNSRLELSRLQRVFDITPSPWLKAMNIELDHIVENASRNGNYRT
jgi:dTDP-4-dehydrorhamnose reductase